MNQFTLPTQIYLVTLWARRDFEVPARARAKVTYESPDGVHSLPTEYTVDLTTWRRFRNISRMDGVPISGPGRYIFKVELYQEQEERWDEVARVPLEIIFGKVEEHPAMPG